MTKDNPEYCKHGTYIGPWWGPDYLCYWCEEGIDPPPPRKYKEIGRYQKYGHDVLTAQELNRLTEDLEGCTSRGHNLGNEGIKLYFDEETLQWVLKEVIE